MGYATISHIAALNAARPITATSRPNLDQVAGFLDETSAVIDAILSGRGFSLPIPTTATAALKLLEGYNAKLAWPMVERAAPVHPQADAADKAAMYAEKMLQSMEPPQLSRDAATTRARHGGTGSSVLSRDLML